MYYINSASSITFQNTFSQKGFSKNMMPLNTTSSLIQPNYRDYIEAGALRRMSEIIKMATCCTLDCIKESGIEQPDAIIVGTGLGCLSDTEKFVKNVVSSAGGLISPTPFIQSTHNTVAGQLSLILKNHNYNITHTQNSLSFEHALSDSLMCLDENKNNVLVGGADEYVPALTEFSGKLGYGHLTLTSGASFFIISKQEGITGKAVIKATSAFTGSASIESVINTFFKEQNIDIKSVDIILFSSSDKNTEIKLKTVFADKIICDYQNYCGTYFSNSAFALHLAADILERKTVKFEFMHEEQESIKRVLICNTLNKHNIGLTLLEAIEA